MSLISRFRPWPYIAIMLVGMVGPTPMALGEPIADETRVLFVEAVEIAFALDLYNSRCRGDLSGRHGENLNKELVSRFRMTVIDVQDDYFPEAYYRAAQARMEADFLARLRALGGCAGAKAAGLRETLRVRYQDAMAALARQP